MTQPTNDPAWSGTVDPERLAALLEGRLEGAQRDELLARLAEDEEDLALFAEAAAIQRELEAEDGRVHDAGESDADAEDTEDAHPPATEPGVIPLRRPARPARVLDRRWLAAAAMVAGLALIPFAWRATQGGAARGPSEYVAMLGNPSEGLPPKWLDDTLWPVTRGGGVTLEEQTLAVRTGARMVGLEVAARAGDAESTLLLAGNVASDLETTTAGIGTIAAKGLEPLIDRAGAGAPAPELVTALQDAQGSVADAVDADWYALGAWTEAARLAAARRDTEFFRDRRTRRTLERADELVGNDEEARAALSTIRASLRAEPVRWPNLESALRSLLAAVA